MGNNVVGDARARKDIETDSASGRLLARNLPRGAKWMVSNANGDAESQSAK